MGLIFDLDQTLIDSSLAEKFRSTRNWSSVYATIPQFSQYNGLINSLHTLKKEGLKICIVTSSPSAYCNRVLTHWNIPFDYNVCYHDTTNKKPHPEPILKALKLLNLPANKALSFGDRDVDIIASNQAGVASVACTWGSADITSLIKANPTYTANNISEMLILIKNFKFI
ncbi:HAD-IIIA family hydrolase [Chitinophaga oryzae]|uniref:phosphoglycolate phosphatase n=1 Tax=Chitinophaga oryzae TaxID=2725414 RepID=A0AAE6ZC08_9BACT|nr:HAD-IIIA family hydrolase [Chitinophaga oryzae]QJB29891.1 HAD-IIIA family hydrolase [Chitinophaga oryzae]